MSEIDLEAALRAAREQLHPVCSVEDCRIKVLIDRAFERVALTARVAALEHRHADGEYRTRCTGTWCRDLADAKRELEESMSKREAR